MTKINGGYYIKARCITESNIARAAPYVREIWDWLLREANHTDTKICKRGQTIRTFRNIQDGLAWYAGWRKHTYTKDQCEKAMKWLRGASMIATEKTTRGLVITLLNYDKFQDPSNYENNNESNRRATRKQHPADTINKNDNNVKKERNKEDIILHSERGSPVNELMNLFYEINPGLNFGNKTQREALKWLVEKTGLEKATNTIKYAISVQGQPYAPTITTPLQLKNKLGDLMIFHKKQNANLVIDLSNV